MENKSEQFRTKDLYLASVLYAMGMSLLRVDRVGPRCWFVFGDTAKCEGVQAELWAKKVVVNAKDLIEAIRSLKDMIFINN